MARVLKGDFSKNQQVKTKGQSTDEPVPGYRLKIAVAFSDPLIWRTIQVPGTMTLARLHQVIQICMGWDESESHQFLVGKIFYQPGFGIKNMQREAEYDENNFELHQLEEGMQFLFTYLYDGGEGWELEISLEEVIRAGLGPHGPILLDGERACPPADIGDIHHYQVLLSDVEAGDNGERARVQLSEVPGFDPDTFDHQVVASHLAALK